MKTSNTKDQELSGTPLTEIEQLRQAIGLASGIFPEMVVDPDPIWLMEMVVKEVDVLRKIVNKESDEPSDEIGQLRQAIGLATTLHPAMTMRPDDPIGMMKQLEAYVGNLEHALKAANEHN